MTAQAARQIFIRVDASKKKRAAQGLSPSRSWAKGVS